MKKIKLLLATCIAFFAFTTAAFADSGLPITMNAPSIPSSLNVGDSNTYTYTLVNHTGAYITVTSINITGNSTSATIASTCSAVPAYGSCNFTTNIAPTSSDVTNGIHDTVNVTYNGRQPFPQLTSAINITVSGSGPTPTASLSSPTPAITTTVVSGTSQIISYTLTNTGMATITSVSISGYSGSVSLSSNTCTGSVAPSASCTFTLSIAPEAEDIGTVPQQTISVNYGGASPLTTMVGPLTVTNPAMVAVGRQLAPSVAPIAYASTDLGQTWTDISSNVGFSSSSLIPVSVAGGATVNGSGQLLNDTLIIVTNVANGEAHYLPTSSNIASSSWSSSLCTIGATNTFGTIGYGNLNNSPYFFTGISVSGGAGFGYSLNGSTITKTSQAEIPSNDPTATGFGGGYYLYGTGGNGGLQSPQLYYTTDPTGTWTASPDPGISTTTSIKGIAYAKISGVDTWVMVAASNVYYSHDLTGSWSVISLGALTLAGIVYDNLLGEFVVIASNGNYYVSTTGTSGWTNPGQIPSFVATALTYSRSTGVMVAVGTTAKIFYSSGNSINWQAATAPAGNIFFRSVASSTST
jgi:hypothetical protein